MSKFKQPKLEQLHPLRRRRFLQLLSAAVAAPMIPSAVRYAAKAMAGGEAWAAGEEENKPTYFIEINLRDQWDHGHFMVAPGLATFANLRRGESGRRAALFYRSDELSHHSVNGTDVYLTDESRSLEPHLDSIAMIDCCELSTGTIHGHESANPVRSPGRAYGARPGAGAMFSNDPVDNFPQGCEAFYSSTPTPATVHNFHQRQLSAGVKPGVIFKGISRGIHTVYHYAGALGAEAELRRHYNRDTLFGQFPDTVQDYNILPSQEEAAAVADVLAQIDPKYLDRRRYREKAIEDHSAAIGNVRDHLYIGEPKLVSMPLTEAEIAYWSPDVPDQVRGGPVRGQLWEQVAWAHKLVANDLTRSVALEFDYVDQHDFRNEGLLRTETAQAAICLARLVAKLKESGIYDRTLIAMYTTDGSRAPAGSSNGSEGKNTTILAGGMIKGGYYGDIQVAGDDGDGHRYRYHAPDDDTGAPRPGVTDNSSRVSSARLWRTVMKAAGVPDVISGSFPDVAAATSMDWLLR